MGLEAGQSAGLVDFHEAAVANHVRGQDRGQSVTRRPDFASMTFWQRSIDSKSSLISLTEPVSRASSGWRIFCDGAISTVQSSVKASGCHKPPGRANSTARFRLVRRKNVRSSFSVMARRHLVLTRIMPTFTFTRQSVGHYKLAANSVYTTASHRHSMTAEKWQPLGLVFQRPFCACHRPARQLTATPGAMSSSRRRDRENKPRSNRKDGRCTQRGHGAQGSDASASR